MFCVNEFGITNPILFVSSKWCILFIFPQIATLAHRNYNTIKRLVNQKFGKDLLFPVSKSCTLYAHRETQPPPYEVCAVHKHKTSPVNGDRVEWESISLAQRYVSFLMWKTWTQFVLLQQFELCFSTAGVYFYPLKIQSFSFATAHLDLAACKTMLFFLLFVLQVLQTSSQLFKNIEICFAKIHHSNNCTTLWKDELTTKPCIINPENKKEYFYLWLQFCLASILKCLVPAMLRMYHIHSDIDMDIVYI